MIDHNKADASRLYTIVDSLIKNGSQNVNQPCRECLMKTFQLGNLSDNELVVYWTGCIQLVEQARIQIKASLPEYDDKDDSVFNEILLAFTRFALNAPVNDFLRSVSDATRATLRTYARVYNQTHFSSSVESEQITEIREQVHNLIQDVKDSDLSPELKQLILRELERIFITLAHCQIWGSDGIAHAFNSSYGDVVANLSHLSTEKENSLVMRFLGIIKFGIETFNSVALVHEAISNGTMLFLGH